MTTLRTSEVWIESSDCLWKYCGNGSGTTQKLSNLNYYTRGRPYGTLVGVGQIDNTSVAFANIRHERILDSG